MHHFSLSLCYMHAKLFQSSPTICNPVECSLPGFPVHGILQARILERVDIPSSRGPSSSPTCPQLCQLQLWGLSPTLSRVTYSRDSTYSRRLVAAGQQGTHLQSSSGCSLVLQKLVPRWGLGYRLYVRGQVQLSCEKPWASHRLWSEHPSESRVGPQFLVSRVYTSSHPGGMGWQRLWVSCLGAGDWSALCERRGH